jgi:hypothetical protein
MDPKDLNLDFDFNNPSGLLDSIKKNDIISISKNSFASVVIKFGGILSLPMFEDISRLFATILATTVPGETVFSKYWAKRSKDIFLKLEYFGLKYLRN